MRYLQFFIFLSVLAGTIISCDPAPCRSGDEIMMKMGFYTYNNKNVRVDSLVDRFTLEGVDCLPDTDCVFYNNVSNVSKVEVFLSMVNDSSRFVFWIETVDSVYYDTSEVIHIDSIKYYVSKAIDDTIVIIPDSLVRVRYIDTTTYITDPDIFTVNYSRIQSMESPDCGVYIDFKINSIDYTKKYFDTLIIMQPNVDENGFENIIAIF